MSQTDARQDMGCERTKEPDPEGADDRWAASPCAEFGANLSLASSCTFPLPVGRLQDRRSGHRCSRARIAATSVTGSASTTYPAIHGRGVEVAERLGKPDLIELLDCAGRAARSQPRCGACGAHQLPSLAELPKGV